MNAFGISFPISINVPQNQGLSVVNVSLVKKTLSKPIFSQVSGNDGGCQEVIRKLQTFAAIKSKPLPSLSTAAYCQARNKLDMSEPETILQHTANQLLNIPNSGHTNGRRVIVADGTGVSMPDTIASQLVWPQQQHQKAG